MPFATRPRFDWHLRTRTIPLGERTLLMGIVNITPDSFSDPGHHQVPEQALAHALTLLDQGADILDIGGESTRPDATPITSKEEQTRVLPVLEAILHHSPQAILSIDTYHAATARAALAAGVEIVNDVSGLLWDTEMAEAVAESHCGLVMMHTRGRPQEWATQPPLAAPQVLPHILEHLRQRLHAASQAGIARQRIVLDPGFGFGIRGEANIALHAGLAQLHTLGAPILTGTSRKGFLRRALSPEQAEDPAAWAAINTASQTAAILAGTHILRVHDIPPARAAAALADAILHTANGPL